MLVELFTSEGCSSCPPADALLAQIERARGAIVLAHHVDYWDGLGWRDPFSSSAATARQRAYATAIGGGTYTPEAVIDGRVQLVANRRASLEEAIEAAAKKTHASVAGEIADGAMAVRVGALPADAADDAELVIATVKPSARVVVTAGENAGRTLDHVAIARSVFTAAVVPRAGGAWKVVVEKDVTRAVAFVQEKKSRRVLGAARLVTPGP